MYVISVGNEIINILCEILLKVEGIKVVVNEYILLD